MMSGEIEPVPFGDILTELKIALLNTNKNLLFLYNRFLDFGFSKENAIMNCQMVHLQKIPLDLVVFMCATKNNKIKIGDILVKDENDSNISSFLLGWIWDASKEGSITNFGNGVRKNKKVRIHLFANNFFICKTKPISLELAKEVLKKWNKTAEKKINNSSFLFKQRGEIEGYSGVQTENKNKSVVELLYQKQ